MFCIIRHLNCIIKLSIILNITLFKNMYNDLFWVSTAICYWAFPLAGIGRVIKVIHIAYKLR